MNAGAGARGLAFCLLAVVALAACGPGRAPVRPASDSAPPGTAVLAAALPSPAPAVAETAPPESPPAPEPAPAERFDPSLPTEVAVAGDRVAQVAHGATGNRRAIVYLHGVCGDIHKFRAWTEVGVHFGTVVAVPGDDKCKDAGRFKWGFDVRRTDLRIVAAVRAVGEARGAGLDAEAITLVGYSQGSARAEALVRAFPQRYRRAVLVAGPHEHTPSSFREALGIAIVAGGKDLKTHLQDSALKAAKAGVHARYFELPGARHGEYGAEGTRVMGDALAWVFGDTGGAATSRPVTAAVRP